MTEGRVGGLGMVGKKTIGCLGDDGRGCGGVGDGWEEEWKLVRG